MGNVLWVLWVLIFILYIVCLIVEHNLSDDERFKLRKYDIAPKRLLVVYSIWAIVFVITGIMSIIVLIKRW